MSPRPALLAGGLPAPLLRPLWHRPGPDSLNCGRYSSRPWRHPARVQGKSWQQRFSSALVQQVRREEVVGPQWHKVHHSMQRDPYRVARRVFPLILLHGALASLLLTVAHLGGLHWRLPPVVHPLLGGVLGLLLAFRTNQAYERHWKSCNAWARVQKTLMNMGRTAGQLSSADWDKYCAIMRHLMIFPIVLKQMVQQKRDPFEYGEIMTEWEDLHPLMQSRMPQTTTLATLSMLVRPLRLQDDGTGKKLTLWSQLEAGLNELQEQTASLELIVKMKLPKSYGIHVGRFIFLWVSTLPFALLDLLHPVGVLCTLVCVAWALYSTEDLAQLMEEPFGTRDKPETIPVGTFCAQIVDELKEQIDINDELDSRVATGAWVVKPEEVATGLVVTTDSVTVTPEQRPG